MKVKKFFSGVLSAVMTFMMVVMPNITMFTMQTKLSVSAEMYNDLEYTKIDSNGDGVVDCIEITGCDREQSIESIIIPKSIEGLPVTSIGDLAFWVCERLVNIEIPNSIKRIGKRAFEYCTRLESIEIPNGTIHIGNKAFYECTCLESIEISSSVAFIGEEAFRYCTKLENLNVSKYNRNYSSHDGVLYNKDKTVLIQYPIGNSRKEYKIPNGVTNIEDNAFYGCTSLESIDIPDSVTRIGGRAFYNTTWLKTQQEKNPLVIVNSILIDAVTCEGDIIIPDVVTIIGGHAFDTCTHLTSVTIPNSVTRINNWAFGYCVNLTNIEIPYSVTRIGDCAFYRCLNLANITILNSECDIYYSDGTICNNYDCNTLMKCYFNGTIYGYNNSTAQEYAKKYGYKFNKTEAMLCGDVNEDCKLNVRDSAFIARKLAQGKASDLPQSADYNKDGKINVRDAAAIAKFLASGGK